MYIDRCISGYKCICVKYIYISYTVITDTHTHILTLSREPIINVTSVAMCTYGDLIMISKYYSPLMQLGEMADFRTGVGKEQYESGKSCDRK